MKQLLKSNERLARVKIPGLRAPDGTLIESALMIVPAEETDPASVATVRENERLVVAGTVHTARKAAEARYAASLAGQSNPRADGTPFYIKEAAVNVNKTGLSESEQKACEPLINELIAAFAATAQKGKA